MRHQYSPAGLDEMAAERVAERLQDQLIALVDMSLSLKNAHWNVVGPGFIAAHELLDDHADRLRTMADELAERIATLGGIPSASPGFMVERRTWEDYAIGRAVVAAHLGALDKIYDRIVADHRRAIADIESDDVVTADLLTEQARSIELLQWLVRAHLVTTSGQLPTSGEETPLDAAAAAATADPRS